MSQEKHKHDIAVAVGLMVEECTMKPDLIDLVLGARSLRTRYEESKSRIAELEGARAKAEKVDESRNVQDRRVRDRIASRCLVVWKDGTSRIEATGDAVYSADDENWLLTYPLNDLFCDALKYRHGDEAEPTPAAAQPSGEGQPCTGAEFAEAAQAAIEPRSDEEIHAIITDLETR